MWLLIRTALNRFIEHDIRFDTDISQVTEKILREVWGEDFNSDYYARTLRRSHQ